MARSSVRRAHDDAPSQFHQKNSSKSGQSRPNRSLSWSPLTPLILLYTKSYQRRATTACISMHRIARRRHYVDQRVIHCCACFRSRAPFFSSLCLCLHAKSLVLFCLLLLRSMASFYLSRETIRAGMLSAQLAEISPVLIPSPSRLHQHRALLASSLFESKQLHPNNFLGIRRSPRVTRKTASDLLVATNHDQSMVYVIPTSSPQAAQQKSNGLCFEHKLAQSQTTNNS